MYGNRTESHRIRIPNNAGTGGLWEIASRRCNHPPPGGGFPYFNFFLIWPVRVSPHFVVSSTAIAHSAGFVAQCGSRGAAAPWRVCGSRGVFTYCRPGILFLPLVVVRELAIEVVDSSSCRVASAPKDKSRTFPFCKSLLHMGDVPI